MQLWGQPELVIPRAYMLKSQHSKRIWGFHLHPGGLGSQDRKVASDSSQMRCPKMRSPFWESSWISTPWNRLWHIFFSQILFIITFIHVYNVFWNLPTYLLPIPSCPYRHHHPPINLFPPFFFLVLILFNVLQRLIGVMWEILGLGLPISAWEDTSRYTVLYYASLLSQNLLITNRSVPCGTSPMVPSPSIDEWEEGPTSVDSVVQLLSLQCPYPDCA